MFRPEYAEVLGVPFSFMPANPRRIFAARDRIRVHADSNRPEIRFPRVDGYRVEFPRGRLNARFTPESHLTLSALWPEIPKETDTDPLVGVSNVLKLDDLHEFRADDCLHAG
ncbi:MAG: hypothetical protein IPO30_20485 [Hyphomonadaceae bacterium]|nr:hypothetical protein [Hyphomonadaceae bacterium]